MPYEFGRDAPPSHHLLLVENVSRSFGGVRAVDDVTFAVKRGQIRGLIGPNGAGKSTLMNLISGVLSIDRGNVVFEGAALKDSPPHQISRRGLQRTFQHERLFSHLTIAENIMVGAEHGADGTWGELGACALGLPYTIREEIEAKQTSRKWLASLGLSDYADAATGKVPHGLRKLVEVARACAAGPTLLLLDETVAGLNDAERQSFQKVIRTLRSKGLTIVIIEHDVEFIMDLCDEICVLNFGKAIADGPPAKIRQNRSVREAYLGT